MPMYNLVEYSDNYSKTCEILWQYCRDEPALDDDGTITDLTEYNADTNFFEVKQEITAQMDNNGTKNVKIMVSLNYLSNF